MCVMQCLSDLPVTQHMRQARRIVLSLSNAIENVIAEIRSRGKSISNDDTIWI